MAVLRLLHALYLRLVGIFLIAGGALYLHAHLTQGPFPGIVLAAAAALGAIGLFLLVPWWQPRGLRRPARPGDVKWIAVHVVVGVFLPLIGHPIGLIFSGLLGLQVDATVLSEILKSPALWAAPPVVLTSLLLGLPILFGKFHVPTVSSPTPSMQPVKPGRPARLPEKKLPPLGAAMKLYIVADWTILRAVGFGLMATAYLIWTLLEADRTAQAELLSHGKAPMTALLIYGGVGAILGLPFLLPRSIARPGNVAFGMVKAALLIGGAFVLIAPMNLAIVEYTPKIYHPTLLETVPRLFKAICGIAVTAAVLISFFRQLGALPSLDDQANSAIHLSAAELHDLRKARMQATVLHP